MSRMQLTVVDRFIEFAYLIVVEVMFTVCVPAASVTRNVAAVTTLFPEAGGENWM
jgi:hypothetical protein